ncbi:hypothetical protein BaRGS_00005946 [Batillaria attramentaria]|uniref:Uncharacterized protein n=1 Tax=Batillaria attramentaria TaxID=370345 RepID=A0ABD0LUF4_9CAEN
MSEMESQKMPRVSTSSLKVVRSKAALPTRLTAERNDSSNLFVYAERNDSSKLSTEKGTTPVNCLYAQKCDSGKLSTREGTTPVNCLSTQKGTTPVNCLRRKERLQ